MKQYKEVHLVVKIKALVDSNISNERILDIFDFVRHDLEKTHLQVAHGHELQIVKVEVKIDTDEQRSSNQTNKTS